MAVDAYVEDVSTILRLILFICVAVIWAASVFVYWKYRNEFPFNNRSIPLMVFFILASVSLIINNFALFFVVADGWSCRCVGYSLTYAIIVPVIAVSLTYRGVILLYKHNIQEATIHLGNYFVTGMLPEGIDSVEQLQNDHYLRNRHHIQPSFVFKFCLGCFLGFCAVVFFFVFGLNWPEMAVPMANGVIVLVAIFSIWLAYKMRHRVKDSSGISGELEQIGLTTVMSVFVYLMSVVLFPDFTDEVALTQCLQIFMLTMMPFVTFVRPLQVVWISQRNALKASPVTPSMTIANMNHPVAPVNTVPLAESTSRAFNTTVCMELSFSGIVSSQRGFFAFLHFLRSEFLAEDLLFWLQVRILSHVFQHKLQTVKAGISAVDGPRGSAVVQFDRLETKSFPPQDSSDAVSILSEDEKLDVSVPQPLSVVIPNNNHRGPEIVVHTIPHAEEQPVPKLAAFGGKGSSQRLGAGAPGTPSRVGSNIERWLGLGKQQVSAFTPRSPVNFTPVATNSFSFNVDAAFDFEGSFVSSITTIYSMYVAKGANHDISIDAEVKERIIQKMQALEVLCADDPRLLLLSVSFDNDEYLAQQAHILEEILGDLQEASDGILSSLRSSGPYMRFKKSPRYQQLAQSVHSMRLWQKRGK